MTTDRTGARLEWRSANIGRDVTQALARANMTKIRRTGQALLGVAWQELDDDDRADERAILDDLFPRDQFTTWPPRDSGAGHLVPITLPRPWQSVDQWAHKVSDGRSGISPDRYVTIRLATHPELEGDQADHPVAFVSFQLVAGAFTNKGQAAEDYRRDAWASGWAGAKVIVRDLVRDGVSVIWSADTNRPKCPAIHPRETRVATHDLDCTGFVRGAGKYTTRIVPLNHGVIPLTIDGHECLRVTYRIGGRPGAAEQATDY